MPIRAHVLWVVIFFITRSVLQAQLCESITEPTPTGIETLIGTLGSVDLISRELTPPCDGFQAGIITARAQNQDAQLVTLTNIGLYGAHQVHSSLDSRGTALGWRQDALYHPDWEYLDSHFLVTSEMIAGGVFSIRESNDGTTTGMLGLPSILDGVGTAKSGYGTTAMGTPTDAFFVHPDHQTQSLDLAYVVAPAGTDNPVQMTFGMLGAGITDDGGIGHVSFGYEGNPAISFPPNAIDPTKPVPGTMVGSIISPTMYNETIDVDWGQRTQFQIPVTTAPPPDKDSLYSVALTDVAIQGPDGFSRQNLYPVEFPADITTGIHVPFQSFDAGTHQANYSLTFNDGTTIDAFLTANVAPRPERPDFSSIAERCTGDKNGFVFAALGGVALISIQQDVEADGLFVSKIVACTLDPDAAIVTLTNLSITGAHQVWAPDGIQQDGGTVLGRPMAGPLYHEEWIPFDSHLLISENMIAGGVYDIAESNDRASPHTETLPTLLDSQSPVAGFGTLGFEASTDAFFLRPEFQQSSVEIAYVVTEGDTEITLGFLGSGITDAGTAGGAAFGYDGNETVSLPMPIPEPQCNVWTLIVALMFAKRRRAR